MALTVSERLDAAAEALERQDFPASERELRDVIEEKPGNLKAHTLLGCVLAKTGRLSEAERHLGIALSLDPNEYDALTCLASVKKTQEDLPAAIRLFERATRVRADEATTFNDLGLCLLKLKDGPKAADAFKKAITLEPLAGQGYHNLGRALSLGGSNPEAFSLFKRAAELDPVYAGNYVQLFRQMQSLLNWEEGLPLLEEGVRRNSGSPALLASLAVVYGKLGRSEMAESSFKSAWRPDPGTGSNYAHWLQEEGRFEDSVKVLQETVRRDPLQGSAYHDLAVVKRFDVGGRSLIELTEPMIKHPGLRPDVRMHIFYALAKSFDEQEDFQKSMHCYDQANALAYRLYNSKEVFDAEASRTHAQELQSLFSKETVARIARYGSSSATPIFIVGMIRSGTTLLDQIISSHPLVRSAGEQVFWHYQANLTLFKWRQSGTDPADVGLLAEKYLQVLNRVVGASPKVTDKMPINYYYLGLIRVAFPQARIVHLRRNPMDTAVSIYTTFLGNAAAFAYNKRNIVGAYRLYLGFMEYWRSVLPLDRFLEVDYERLVSDKEPVIAKILDFCGLEWDDACLSYDRNPSPVNTPSLWTARQPINTGSLHRWLRYEPWLGELNELATASHPEIPM